MPFRAGPIVLAVTVIGAGVFALTLAASVPATRIESRAPEAVQQPVAKSMSLLGTLPPGHPPIGAANSPLESMHAAADEAPTIRWSIPNGWQPVVNPNPMRLATYRVPGARDDQSAEMSVARAGGTTDANIQRWVDQFDQAGQDTQTEKTIRGLHVSIVEVAGTYLGGGMSGAPSSSHPGWALLAAIVEAGGSNYFFKLTGPAATLRAARGKFDSLVESITPR